MNILFRHLGQAACGAAMSITVACAFAAAASIASVAQAAAVGETAPNFRLPTAGAETTLAEFKGRVVYLDFWASWCGPCKQSFPWMNSLADRYRDKGLEIIAVNVDTSRPPAERFLKSLPARFTVAFDASGNTAKQYAVTAMPMSYLIDVDGKVLLAHSGFKPADTAAIENAIEQALKKVKAK